MNAAGNVYLGRVSAVANRMVEFARRRRARWAGGAVAVILMLFTIAGFFVVPHVVRGILTEQVAALLHRQVTVGRIRFNPYTLRLQVADLRVGDPSEKNPLATFGRIDVNASWTSAFRVAPVVSDLTIARPVVNIVRTPGGAFNFSDILASLSAPAEPSSTSGSSPTPKFAVSNIRILDGTVTFDDQEAGQRHVIDKLQLGIPFIANLPGHEEIVVEPLLQMSVDGRPVRISGVSRPFAGKFDSAVNFSFHRIELPPYASYLPPSMPIKLPSGALSLNVLLHFKQEEKGPSIELSGAIAVDQLDLRDASGAPVISMDHGEVKMADVEPFDGVFDLSEITVRGLKAELVRQHDGQTNIATLLGTSVSSAQPAPPPVPKPQAAATPAASSGAPPEAAVDLIKIVSSSVSVTDLSGAKPAAAALQNIDAAVTNLRLNGQVPADFQAAANLQSGGTISLKGKLDLAKSDVQADVAVDKVDLPPLQTFVRDFFAGTIKSGSFSAHGRLDSHFAGDKFNLHSEPADVAIDDLGIDAAGSRKPPLAWSHFGVSLASFDLAARQVEVKEVRADGIKLFARRDRGGTVNLLALIKQSPSSSEPQPGTHPRAEGREDHDLQTTRPSTAPERPWRYQVESVAIEKTEARFDDRAGHRFVRVELSPLNIHLKGFSSDFTKPFSIEMDGVRNRRGSFKIEGTAAIDPLKADLHLDTKRLDLAEADNYVSSWLNADITSAALTVAGDLSLAQDGSDYKVKYHGGATVGDFATTDKVTGDPFLNWKSLSISEVDADIGDSPPMVHLGRIALSDFYARLILNRSGKLNLNDITSAPSEQPKSLTREQAHPAVAPSAAPTPTAEKKPASNGDIQVAQITLQDGHIDYTDDFIKPHYSANLSEISGSIGEFGTTTQQPALVELRGQVNGSAPLSISGKINPLAPMAFVDLRAKADSIELTGLSPYSTKYTGYPIVKGTLTAHVHYLLDQGELKASNHLFINQLTFGDRVENSTATNLPVRFAVAVLKNSRGEIDLRIPVSGSLSDPQFSIGAVIWEAFVGVIKKAITSPFSVLSSTVGGVMGEGGTANLSYIVFEPGRATLNDKAKQKLTTLGNALQDHPALKLSICGRVDPSLDLQGLREAWLEDQIRAQKIRREGGAGDPESVKVTPEDYDKYLARAYSHAKIPKPRNFIGFAKTLPPDQMKKLMLENAPISPDALKQLADARANIVRQYLSATVKPGRLFIVPTQLNADGIKEGPTTRVDLSLQ
jgi:hypothetical protein